MPENQKMSRSTTAILLVYFMILGVLSIDIILSVWPAAASLSENRTVSMLMNLFTVNLNAELTFLLIVIFSGIIGAFVQSLSSIAIHQSRKDLGAEWSIWYLTRPFVGAALALALYFLLRGGFLGLGTDPSSINVYGIAGLSGISGMFTNQATQKLRDVAEALLKTEEKPTQEPTAEAKPEKK